MQHQCDFVVVENYECYIEMWQLALAYLLGCCVDCLVEYQNIKVFGAIIWYTLLHKMQTLLIYFEINQDNVVILMAGTWAIIPLRVPYLEKYWAAW